MNTYVATVHEGKKPFKCDHCNSSFGIKRSLKRHIATIHEGKKPFKCDIGQKFELNKHVATVHEGHK